MISYIVNMDEFVEKIISELKTDFELADSSNAKGITRIIGESFNFEDGLAQTKIIIPSFTGVLKQIILKKNSNEKVLVKITINNYTNEISIREKEVKFINDGFDYIIKDSNIEIEVNIPKNEKVWVDLVCLTPKGGD